MWLNIQSQVPADSRLPEYRKNLRMHQELDNCQVLRPVSHHMT